jgi:hypothetical protein
MYFSETSVPTNQFARSHDPIARIMTLLDAVNTWNHLSLFVCLPLYLTINHNNTSILQCLTVLLMWHVLLVQNIWHKTICHLLSWLSASKQHCVMNISPASWQEALFNDGSRGYPLLRGSFFGATAPSGPWPLHSWGFLDHTQRRTTIGRTPLDEWPARHRDLYLPTHNTHNRPTPIPWWDSYPQSQQASGRRPTP